MLEHPALTKAEGRLCKSTEQHPRSLTKEIPDPSPSPTLLFSHPAPTQPTEQHVKAAPGLADTFHHR